MSILAAITEAYALLPDAFNSDRATLLLLAIQRQEDPELLRYQRVKRVASTLPDNVVDANWAKGPARGAWQFEQGGAVNSLLGHRATWKTARDLCAERGVLFSAGAIWRALEHDDVLAAGFARLLLWSDPKPLPLAGDEQGAFDLYLRTWRPGAYHRGTPEQKSALRQKFHAHYANALDQLTQALA